MIVSNVYLFVVILIVTDVYSAKDFDDTVLFDIQWPGDLLETNLELNNDLDSLVITSVHQEKYKCLIPNTAGKESKRSDNYKGPTPLELLAPLFSQSSCSYRLESYWTYEICHGKYIRQYHEDREGKKIKLQEYYLGRWNKGQYFQLLDDMKSVENGSSEKLRTVPVKKIDSVNLPYLELEMGNGTLCDLNDRPRSTKVLYVCYLHGKHEVYSLKETSTCNYEIIVLSPLLCVHPRYKPQDTGENLINCIPIEGSPKKPRSLLEMKAESYNFRHRKSEETRVRVEIHPIDLLADQETSTRTPPETPVDTSPVESFLSGKNCLNGGSGWWKYEFCYGKTVEQYHIERDGSKTSILLGKFNKEKHLKWIRDNPQKRPKPQAVRKQLSHFYSDGTICDKTGRPRQTVVKLKCLENTQNLGAVSLYLLEPKYCEYVLGVESPLICEILQRADENGLVESDLFNAIDETDTTSINKVIRS